MGGDKGASTESVPQFLYVIRPARLAMLTEGSTDQEAAIIADHFEYLRMLTERNVVILAGRTLTSDETSFGIVILRAQNDPAVKERVMHAVLYPYRVALLGGLEE
jgi:uncharacterized protein YciI